MTRFSLRKKLGYSSFIFLVFLFLLTLLGESAVRLITGDKYKQPVPTPPYDSVIPDEVLGWKPKPGYAFSGRLTDYTGREYDLSLQFDKNGFKTFGDTTSRKPKVLVIGDSYTSSIEVSNKFSYFSILEDSLDLEVFAFGQAGYSTLQELMVLDQWVDSIRPDLVIWQFCCNDFIDNYAPLEMAAGYKIGKKRPYLDDVGTIYHQRPLSKWQKTKEYLHFYRWLEDHWHPFKKKVLGKDRVQAEDHIRHLKMAYQPFHQSVRITQSILNKVKMRLPSNTAIMAFSADYYPIQIKAAQQVFKQAGIPFTDLPARSILLYQSPDNCKAADGYHWNETGHKVVATSLLPLIREILD